MGQEYAVIWRDEDGHQFAGALTLKADRLRLRGRGAFESSEREIGFEQIVAVRVGRDGCDRIHEARSLVLDLQHGAVKIAVIGAPGAVVELTTVLSELVSEQRRDSLLAIILPLRPGVHHDAGELIRQGPPFSPENMPILRHHVLLSEQEAVFIFEGEHVRAALASMAQLPSMLDDIGKWRELIDGEPRIALEIYRWQKPAEDRG